MQREVVDFQKIIVLTGPTAVGKTALALEWAVAFGGEILNADSRQIYREMDIGTAKPTPAERAQVPHHLLDVVAPDQTLTLAQYQVAAQAAISEIGGRGRVPILCGGTGMYITALLEGWQMPEVPPDPALRATLEALPREELFGRLQALDPQTAASIDRDNPRRLVRALEVRLITGESFVALRRKAPPPLEPLCFVLDMPRSELYARADARVESMLARGWVVEVAHLLDRYPAHLPAMSALGYPQIAAHLRGDLPLEDALAEIRRATRSFIRRQSTWIRGHGGKDFVWLIPEQDAKPQIAAFLG
ncbi:MAG: tRNA (adenosine(37)-N6)-dimethylallyltransferase MiaA [Anaerolineae bacterium]|nr:tRNA (adenosine(37)-N6)-dimethylallyltransferase MiaA [Anaerolineae bacterium]